jgi:MFS family permease
MAGMTGRVIAGAAISTVLGTLPVFLLGGLAVLMRRDLPFSEAQLGAAATAFFLSSALCSYPAGRVAERAGAYRATATAAVLSAAGLLGIALIARTYPLLLACLVVAGVGNALAQLGSNAALARGVARERQGFAFGVKQSAIPISTLLAGLAVPALGLTVGWRWAFAAAAGVALLFVTVAPRTRVPVRTIPPGTTAREGDVATGPLMVIAAGAGLGAAANNAFGAFLVEAAVAGGLPPGRAGLLFAAGSAAGIASRLLLGWSADRREGGHLPVIAGLMSGGAAGFALLALGGTAGLVLGTMLGFAAGWSWPGLLNFAIVRLNRHAPAAATGVTQTGVFAGGAAGPLIFGVIVEQRGYPAAWLAAAASLVAAVAFVLAGRQRLLVDIRRRAVTTAR